jgi:hypothetical protein
LKRAQLLESSIQDFPNLFFSTLSSVQIKLVKKKVNVKTKKEKISIYDLAPHFGDQSSIFHQFLYQLVKDEVRNYDKSQPLRKSEL